MRSPPNNTALLPRLPGRSVVHKVMTTAYRTYRVSRYRAGLLRAESEAVQVTAAIVRAFDADVTAAGKRFVLAVLPTEHELTTGRGAYWDEWKRMVGAVCGETISCIDLSDGLREMPRAEIDQGYDATHYGPAVNRRIARLLRDYLLAEGLYR